LAIKQFNQSSQGQASIAGDKMSFPACQITQATPPAEHEPQRVDAAAVPCEDLQETRPEKLLATTVA
jgi:hypothetical protein